jgi:glycyl-tRNA synthetase
LIIFFIFGQIIRYLAISTAKVYNSSIQMEKTMEKIVSLAKRKGFIFPSSEIYGGINGCWDYGPLGVELKRNIKNAWWKDMVLSHDETMQREGAPSIFDMVGQDASILMNPKVWEASGHVGGFSDPMTDCRETKARYRADQLYIFSVHAQNGKALSDTLFATLSQNEAPDKEELIEPHKKMLKSIIKAHGDAFIPKIIKDAVTNAELLSKTLAPGAKSPGTLTAPKSFNLMFKTHVGASEDSKSIAYLRPETAQGIFVNFKNICDSNRIKLPFGIAQIGKAFRNEINPRNFTFRSREFEQMEVEFFCKPEESAAWYKFWRDCRYNWYLNYGINKKRLHLREHEKSELAHYAQACADIEYDFPFGRSELEGIANRQDYDLKKHSEHSTKDLSYFDDSQPKENQRYLPHVIEPSAGADRAALAFICNAYHEETVKDDLRIVLKLDPRIAPNKIAIFPLVKKDGMPEMAQSLYRQLNKKYACQYDEKAAIGRRYRRQDEIGTPYCLTVDGDSIKNQTVTVRDRDTLDQIRINIDALGLYFDQKLNP